MQNRFFIAFLLKMKNSFSMIIQNAKASGSLKMNTYEVQLSQLYFSKRRFCVIGVVLGDRSYSVWTIGWIEYIVKRKVSSDNARPYCARQILEKMNKLVWEVLPHPPYSSNIEPMDFHLFLSLHFVSGKKFANLDDV